MSVTGQPELEQALGRLIADRPTFHTGDVEGTWTVLPDTLRMIARHAQSADRTLETGCGASTVVFAASGSAHTAVSPDPAEHRRIRDYCDRIGVDHTRVELVEGYSDLFLPALDESVQFDVAMIDADHSFPYPVVDWHYVNRHLRTGGILVADDMLAPAVAVFVRNMLVSPNWEMLETADGRAGAFRKLNHQLTYDHYRNDPFNRGFPDYSFLGAVRGRLVSAAGRGRVVAGGARRRLRGLSGRGS
jgi:predicted O-methyltransferase YrrM